MIKKIILLSLTIILITTGIFFKLGLHKKEEVVIADKNEDYYSSIIKNYDPEPQWYPNKKVDIKVDTNENKQTQPETMGESVLLVDINSGDILYDKNSKDKHKIASLVKIMTAVIALEHKDINNKFTVSEMASEVGENSMSLSPGEAYSLEELLYGLILNSGNDAAYTIAQNVAGDTTTFVNWMNIKAKELGMKDTVFYDPSGLDDRTTSTAVDLTKLTRYALKNADFKKIVSTLEYELPYTYEHKYLYMYNQTNLLSTYPGVLGVKTGYTEDAGLCLVTYAKNNDIEVVGVVLNSMDRRGDMIQILDYGYSTLGVQIEHNLLD